MNNTHNKSDSLPLLPWNEMENEQYMQAHIFNMDFSIIVRHQFVWELFRFIIFNYYLIEAVLASSFYQMFQYTVTTLMPLNIIFFIYMGADFLFKIACIQPKFKKQQDYRKPAKLIKYYLIKQLLIFDLLFMLFFILSYILPFAISKYLRYAILVKLIEVVEFNNKIYERLHIYPKITKIYTVIKISYVMLLFSHYFGTWFFLIDQVLLDQQFYGAPSQNPDLYYQMNLLAYTPIQSLGNYGRYLYGLYFMVSLITTIAYGDIVGKNPYEQVYVSFLMVISTISLALILEQFMDLVSIDSLGLYDFIKNYNSLKTCMDDSQVSLSTQNKVRSYLIYAEYEKKYHAHEEVAQKLTFKLQSDLKFESYSQAIEQWVIPCMPELNDQVKQLCNICKLVSFQAQSNAYEQMETVNTATQCCFLYKLSGLVQQYIQLPQNKVRIPTKDRKQFNLAKMFLNFNMEVAYDSDDENQEDFIIQKEQGQETTKKRYELISINNRKLKCIKISQFVMLDAQQFYQLVNKKKVFFKRIKHLKQQILSKDLQLSMIGDCCGLCMGISGQDHSIECCPKLHLTYDSRILHSQKMNDLINNKNSRKFMVRKQRKQSKLLNKSLLLRSIFSFAQQMQKPKPVIEDKFLNIFKNILNQISESNKTHLKTSDSVYDPFGLTPAFSLQQY